MDYMYIEENDTVDILNDSKSRYNVMINNDHYLA